MPHSAVRTAHFRILCLSTRMAAVSETIVREYFELHAFFIRQQRKYVAPSRREDEEVDFFVLNPHQVASDKPLPFVLTSNEVPMIARAVVVVKGWHTESFSSAVLAHAPEIFRFVEPPVFQRAAKTFGGGGPPTKILVVPPCRKAKKPGPKASGC